MVLEQYRHKFGDFVRTGPAEITVFDPQIYGILDGPRSVCVKSEWYDLLHPFLSLVSSRDKDIHAARRREWVRCFTSKALNEHENKILKHVAELDRQIEKHVLLQKTSEMRDLCFWFGFDTMGDFVFNKSFRMLTDNKWHSVIVRLQNALSLLGPFSPAPWLVQLGLRLGPSVWVLKDWHDSVSWAKGEMRARLDRGLAKQEKPDLTYYLMEQEAETSFKDSYYWMHGDSLLAIVAGSEPTAYVLLGVFCELAKHPEHAEKIYSELEGADISDMKTLNRLPHLNGVINETLRLYPVLLTGGARKTMSEGINVGDTYIPPNTTIVAPRYSIMRREDCFEKADTFIPERWTTRPEMIRNMAAFNPFSLGHHSCLGRLLAMDTMRYVISTIVKKYQFRLAPGETGSRVFDDMADQFTANPGKLALNFRFRKESS
ncbi:hypothetical protein KJ359_006843 [Pestalotiopsis sp. 9143b]|nr:hypothetical protein KJ359_006843 [Pestalotiopsis sp. 9143b]